MSFLGMQVLLTGSGNFKDIQNSRQNCSKNKLVRENAVIRAHESCSLRVMGSWKGLDNCALSLVFTSINRRSERKQSKAVKKSRHRDVL